MDTFQFRFNDAGELRAYATLDRPTHVGIATVGLPKDRDLYINLRIEPNLPITTTEQLTYTYQEDHNNTPQQPWVKNYSVIQEVPGINWEVILNKAKTGY